MSQGTRPPMTDAIVRGQLLARRACLHDCPPELGELARDVDAAVARLDAGTWGICEVCHDPIEAERLEADPMLRFCIDHLSAREKSSLEADLRLAAQMQGRLVPPPESTVGPWRVAVHSEPASVVGGDFADVLAGPDGGLLLLLGDVSGKGIAASMLAAQLHGTFRALVPLGLGLPELLGSANRLLMASSLPSSYATLVAVAAAASGEAEVAVAGHPPALLLQDGAPRRLGSTGLPLGLFDDVAIGVHRLRLGEGSRLVIYSDGVTEATGQDGSEYGLERLSSVLAQSGRAPAARILAAALADLRSFRARTSDDTTMAVLERETHVS